MGIQVFIGCTNLTTVTIGKNVTGIVDNGTFNGCTSLTAITVDTLNPVYSSLDGVLFDKLKTTLILFPKSKAGTWTIPNSVTSIADDAFLECAGLTSVTIPNSVTSIGDGAFGGCSSLTSVTIPDSVTNIADFAFVGCSSLTSVTIPDSVTSIGVAAFQSCIRLTSVTIGTNVTSIGDSAFAGCSSLTRVAFQGDAPSCGYGAFSGDNPTIYYLLGTTGWDSGFAGLPASAWDPLSQVTCSTANGVVTITGYIGPGGAVTVPTQ